MQLGVQLNRARAGGQHKAEVGPRVFRVKLQMVDANLFCCHVKRATQPGQHHLRRVGLRGDFMNRQMNARVVGISFEGGL